jgi:hypothetical protein
VRLGRRVDGSPRRIRASRWRPPVRVVAALVVTAVVAGVLLAERRADAESAAAAAAARTRLLPLLDELDVLWTAGDPDGPGGALVALRDRDVRPEAAAASVWEAAHAALLVRVVGLDLPGPALGAQRQAVAAVTLSADAAAALARAGEVPEASARRELTREAVRLRVRGEQFAASALAAIEEIRTGGRRISPLPALPARSAP